MTLPYWIALLCLGLIWLPWLYRRVLRPYKVKQVLLTWLESHPKAAQIKAAAALIAKLYTVNDAVNVSLQERKVFGLEKQDSYVYGEIDFFAFAHLLDDIPVKEVFYDLGCGAGKVVYSAALLHDFNKVCGIEILPGLFRFAEGLMANFEQLIAEAPELKRPRCMPQFVHGDILNYDISDATVIFINATCFDDDLWQQLIDHFLDVSPLAHIIVTSRFLPNRYFSLLKELETVMSWGTCSVRVYQRDPNTITPFLNLDQ